VDLGEHAAREAQHAGEEDIHAGISDHLLAVDPLRLTGEEAGRADAVSAHVHERAAAEIGLEPDVAAAFEREAESRAHELKLSDDTSFDELDELCRLRA